MTDSGGTNAGLQSAQNAGEGGRFSRGGLWAVYLGVSWTWCIGMFLPALLWRDFGVWSFAVFAIPNIVGAAAMGWVMKSPEASRVFTQRHRAACVAFSTVTVAFQVFFAAWVARIMGGGIWHAGWVLCVAGVLFPPSIARQWASRVAIAAWLVSIIAIIGTFMREGRAGMLDDLFNWRGVLEKNEIIPLAMVCVLGFGLCPYLDLTFHRARMELGSKADSRAAFGGGFGLFFLVMIVGTILTAPVLLWIVGASGTLGGIGGGGPGVRDYLMILLVAHTLPQLVYTCWVHGSEVRGSERVTVAGAGLLAGLVTTFVSASILVHKFGADAGWRHALYGGEVAYRSFMAFYGLVFPAYIAIVAWPVSSGGRIFANRNLVIFAAVLLAATWFYWTGFVERHTWWTAGGVAMVVLGSVIACVITPKPNPASPKGS